MSKNTLNNSLVAFTIWLLGSTFFCSEYFVRVSTGVLTPFLMNEMNVSTFEIGILSAFFYYSYVSMQIPAGLIVDKYGAKRVLIIATLIFGLSCELFSYMPNIVYGYLYRLMMGLSGSFAFVGTLKLITMYFEPQYFGLLAGFTQGFGMLGAVIGEAPISIVFNAMGWRHSMVLIALIFFVISLLLTILAKDRRPYDINKQKKSANLYTELKAVIRSKQLWLNSIYIGFLYAPTESFGEQWGALFCSLDMRVTLTKGAFLVGFMFLGLAIGCPIIGFISDKLHSRLKVMRFCAFMCLVLISIIIYHKNFNINLTPDMLKVLMFAYGFFNSAIVPSYAFASEVVKRHLSGLALGITNMITVLVGSFFIPIIGLMIHIISHNSHAALNSCSLHSFKVAFLFLPISLIICLLISFLLKDTNVVGKGKVA